jgi:hypothetical protein
MMDDEQVPGVEGLFQQGRPNAPRVQKSRRGGVIGDRGKSSPAQRRILHRVLCRHISSQSLPCLIHQRLVSLVVVRPTVLVRGRGRRSVILRRLVSRRGTPLRTDRLPHGHGLRPTNPNKSARRCCRAGAHMDFTWLIMDGMLLSSAGMMTELP